MLPILLFFLLYLLRLGLGSNESRVASFNENNQHRVCGNIHQWMCVCYWWMLFFYVYFTFLNLETNYYYLMICFLKRQIPHSVSHPLRSQDSVSKSIQLNTERSKSGWRWVYLRFLPLSISSPLPLSLSSLCLPPLLGRISFRKFLCLTTTIAILVTFYKRS